MRGLTLGALVCVLLVVGAGVAWADTITFDFEDEAVTTSFPGLTSLGVTEGGLTATVMRDTFRVYDFSSSLPTFDDRSIQATSTTGTWTINFSATVDSVSIQFGDGGADADTASMSAYSGLNLTGSLVGSDSGSLPFSTSGTSTVDTMTISGSGIRSITFISNGFGGTGPESVSWDNLVVTTSAIPEPTTLALFGLGAGALALRRRRRKIA